MVQISTPWVTPNRGMERSPVRRFLSNYFDLLFGLYLVCFHNWCLRQPETAHGFFWMWNLVIMRIAVIAVYVCLQMCTIITVKLSSRSCSYSASSRHSCFVTSLRFVLFGLNQNTTVFFKQFSFFQFFLFSLCLYMFTNKLFMLRQLHIHFNTLIICSWIALNLSFFTEADE